MTVESAQNPIGEDSLKKRYFHKLFANLFGLGVSLITQAIIPRVLGPKAYGDFSFLTNYFNEVVRLFDMRDKSPRQFLGGEFFFG